ncbi:hypothetical protein [Enterobacter hormaechei]|uniref:hypothetical protein n=1 Tax=Enterobacter hormaechei TaxID=158836 RepID=UPI0013FE0DE1|nr:hypothetical protein [Enterobacter hormaechei]
MASKVDLYLSRVSHFSQFVLVAFAIFGYFYTVRPIYQKELLSEEIAKKEVDLNALKSELHKSNRQLLNNQAAQIKLREDIEVLKQQFKVSEEELNSVNKELATSIRELDRQKKLAKKAIDDNKKNLSSVFWENFEGLVAITYLKDSYRSANTVGEEGSIYSSYDDLYITPYLAINNAIKMGEHNFYKSAQNIPISIRRELLNKISRATTKNKDILSKYPDGFHSTIRDFKRKIDAYKLSKDVNEQMKAYTVENDLRTYLYAQKKISMNIATDFVKTTKNSN